MLLEGRTREHEYTRPQSMFSSLTQTELHYVLFYLIIHRSSEQRKNGAGSKDCDGLWVPFHKDLLPRQHDREPRERKMPSTQRGNTRHLYIFYMFSWKSWNKGLEKFRGCLKYGTREKATKTNIVTKFSFCRNSFEIRPKKSLLKPLLFMRPVPVVLVWFGPDWTFIFLR